MLGSEEQERGKGVIWPPEAPWPPWPTQTPWGGSGSPSRWRCGCRGWWRCQARCQSDWSGRSSDCSWRILASFVISHKNVQTTFFLNFKVFYNFCWWLFEGVLCETEDRWSHNLDAFVSILATKSDTTHSLTCVPHTLGHLERLAGVQRHSPVNRIRWPHHQLLRRPHPGGLWWWLGLKQMVSSHSPVHCTNLRDISALRKSSTLRV